jgi:hypothetical protein
VADVLGLPDPARALREIRMSDDIKTMSNEDRDRALYKILINEGYSRQHVDEMLTANRSLLDEQLVKMMADPRRQRDVEIITPDRMINGVVDLNAKKIQAKSDRYRKELDAESAHEDRTCDQLMAVMEASGLYETSLTSVALRALIGVLRTNDNFTLQQAKENIAMVLNVMVELTARAENNLAHE